MELKNASIPEMLAELQSRGQSIVLLRIAEARKRQLFHTRDLTLEQAESEIVVLGLSLKKRVEDELRTAQAQAQLWELLAADSGEPDSPPSLPPSERPPGEG